MSLFCPVCVGFGLGFIRSTGDSETPEDVNVSASVMPGAAFPRCMLGKARDRCKNGYRK